jgi:hypothetical protein
MCAALWTVGCGDSSGDRSPATAQSASGERVLLVSVSRPADAKSVTSKIARVPGVIAATPLLLTKAYVAGRLEPLYAIEPASFVTVAEPRGFRPAMDVGGEDRPPLKTSAIVARSRSRPDAVWVANEHFHDLLLKPGRAVKLKVADQHGRFRAATFHVAGVSGSFASARRPRIVVANLAYVQRMTGAAGPDSYLVKVTGDPEVARRINAATTAEGGKVTGAAR